MTANPTPLDGKAILDGLLQWASASTTEIAEWDLASIDRKRIRAIAAYVAGLEAEIDRLVEELENADE
jgi:hypothetical protein